MPIKPPRTDGGLALFGESGPWYDFDRQLERIHGLIAQPDLRQRFVNASDVAAYLGLRPVSSLHVPVPLHIVFVGFKGDGNAKLDVSGSDMSEWFDHLDHIIPHVYVPEAALECEGDGDDALRCGAEKPLRPVHSHLHFNLSCHAVELGDGVMEAFERATRLYSRPVDPRLPDGEQQVDAALMEGLVDDLLHATRLADGYTVVVLNPEWDPLRPKYGYRAGLSKAEVDLLAEDLGILEAAQRQPLPKAPKPKGTFSKGDAWKSSRPPPKFSVSEKQFEAAVWRAGANQHLDDLEDERARLGRLLPERLQTGDSLEEARVDFLRRFAAADQAGRDRIRKSLEEAWDAGKPGGGQAAEPLMGPEEGCLVDSWVGGKRWVLMDLTAGAEDWGPSLDGRGRSRSSMPSVEAFFSGEGGSLGGAAGVDAGFGLEATEDEGQGRRGLFEWEKSGGAGDEEESKRPALAALRAELDITRRVWDMHCEEDGAKTSKCQDLEGRLNQLRAEISAAMEQPEQQGGSAELMEGLERHLFGEAPSRRRVSRSAEERQRSKDLFLAQVGSLLSSAIRHVIVPPTSTWHSGDDVWLSPGDVHLPAKVDFTFFMADDISLGTRSKATTERLDIEALQKELERLFLPGQGLSVTALPLALTEDPVLAVSVAVSMRPEMMQASGDLSPVLSIDSRVLHDQIKHRVLDDNPQKHHRGGSGDSLEVPVFVLHAARDVPVVIDGYLLAKSLPDMVLVVLNTGPASKGPHPAGVECSRRLVSLCGTSTLQAALQAIARHIGGALPPHLGYSPVHNEVTHDWAWSVGSHTLSMTSPGWQLSQLTSDVVRRSSAVRVLDASLHTCNAVVQRLRQEPTGLPQAYESITTGPRPLSTQLLQAYVRLVESWTAALKLMEVLDFENLARSLHEVEAHTRELEDVSSLMVEALHRGKCRTTEQGGGVGLLGLAAMCGIVAVIAAAAWGLLCALGLAGGWHGLAKPKSN